MKYPKAYLKIINSKRFLMFAKSRKKKDRLWKLESGQRIAKKFLSLHCGEIFIHEVNAFMQTHPKQGLLLYLLGKGMISLSGKNKCRAKRRLIQTLFDQFCYHHRF